MTTADVVASNADGEEMWELRLYVAVQTAGSARALVSLTKPFDTRLRGHYEIEVVDLSNAECVLVGPRSGVE